MEGGHQDRKSTFMRAISLLSEGVKIVETEIPEPNQNQVLVKVYACGLNRSDLLETQGQSFGHLGNNVKILGGEFAGEVTKVGNNVKNILVGDRVMCRGSSGWAEFALAHELRCIKIDNENISWDRAASIQGSLQTMHDAIVVNAKFKNRNTVFIQGASSGVGIVGLQIAKCLGSSLVVGSSKNEFRRKQLLRYGADDIVDTSMSSWKEKVLEMTDGQGFDIVVDMLSGNYVNSNMEVTKINGHLINIGRLAGMNGDFDYDLHAKRRIHYIGTTGRTRSLDENYKVAKLANDDLWKYVINNNIGHPIDSVFKYEEVIEALNKMNNNNHFGKIILKP